MNNVQQIAGRFVFTLTHVKSKVIKISMGVVIALLGGVGGAMAASLFFAFPATSITTPSLLLLISGLFFLIFIDRVFL